MNNGIRDQKTGDVFTLRCRKEIRGRKDVQEALVRNHHCSQLTCRCLEHLGIYLPITPVLPQGWTELTVSRDDINNHGPGCYLFLEGDASEKEFLRASSILRPATISMPLPGQYAEWAARISRAQYETFASYGRRLISRGFSNGYKLRNNGLTRQSNPSTLEVFAALDAAVREFAFTDAADGYAAAIRMGCRLRFGLVFDRLEINGEANKGFDCYWFKDGLFSPGYVTVPYGAMVPAVNALKILGHCKAPPYLVVGVQNASGTCQRVFFHQVAVEEDRIFPTDSGAEAVCGMEAIKKGAALIKPVLIEDMVRTLSVFGVELADKAKWTYRPDFLFFWMSKGVLTLHVRELRGFKLGTNAYYDQLLVEKKAYYERLKANIAIHYKELDGTALQWASLTDGTEPWLNTGLPEMPALDLLTAQQVVQLGAL